MKFYEASSTIRATPDTIWDILTDGQINPLVKETVEEMQLHRHAGAGGALDVTQVHPLLEPRE